jgi:hypothetical protein
MIAVIVYLCIYGNFYNSLMISALFLLFYCEVSSQRFTPSFLLAWAFAYSINVLSSANNLFCAVQILGTG